MVTLPCYFLVLGTDHGSNRNEAWRILWACQMHHAQWAGTQDHSFVWDKICSHGHKDGSGCGKYVWYSAEQVTSQSLALMHFLHAEYCMYICVCCQSVVQCVCFLCFYIITDIYIFSVTQPPLRLPPWLVGGICILPIAAVTSLRPGTLHETGRKLLSTLPTFSSKKHFVLLSFHFFFLEANKHILKQFFSL